MNAFKYSANEEATKPMATPLIAIVGLTNEGHNRIQKLAEVLGAFDLSFSDYSKLTV